MLICDIILKFNFILPKVNTDYIRQAKKLNKKSLTNIKEEKCLVAARVAHHYFRVYAKLI